MKSYQTNAYTPRRDKRAVKPTTITSGEFRGKALVSPQISATHPMGSRERLALFNSIGPEIKGAVVLDVFAGTGALGLEALSRGAAHVTFIEKNRKAAAAIQSNMDNLGVGAAARLFVARAEAMKFDRKFDIILADPPYDYFVGFSGEVNKNVVGYLNTLGQAAKKLFVLSHPNEFSPDLIELKLRSTKAYAGARISIYEALI